MHYIYRTDIYDMRSLWRSVSETKPSFEAALKPKLEIILSCQRLLRNNIKPKGSKISLISPWKVFHEKSLIPAVILALNFHSVRTSLANLDSEFVSPCLGKCMFVHFPST